MLQALEQILIAIAEFLGFEAAKWALGDIFPIAALSALIAFPLAAGFMEGIVGDRVTYGGFLYYCLGAVCLAVVWVPLILFGFFLAG